MVYLACPSTSVLTPLRAQPSSSSREWGYTTRNGKRRRGKPVRCDPLRLFITADVDALADLIFLGILLVIAIFCIFFNRYLPLLEVRSFL